MSPAIRNSLRNLGNQILFEAIPYSICLLRAAHEEALGDDENAGYREKMGRAFFDIGQAPKVEYSTYPQPKPH